MSKYLAVVLDAESHLYLTELALYPEVRAHHVTLAYPEDEGSFSESWLPPGTQVGEEVTIEAKGFSITEDIQVLVVAIGGTSTRPFDGGTLHITVAKLPGVSSNQSNTAIESVDLIPYEKTLKGKISWLQKGGEQITE